MNKLNLSALAAALALATTAVYANEGNKPMTENPASAQTTQPVDTTAPSTPVDAPKPTTHGQAVSQVAQETRDGQAVSTMAHSVRDFKQLDVDRDGFVTQADVQADTELTAQFADWDDDKDLKLSQAEFDAYIASTVTTDDLEEEAE